MFCFVATRPGFQFFMVSTIKERDIGVGKLCHMFEWQIRRGQIMGWCGVPFCVLLPQAYLDIACFVIVNFVCSAC